MCPLPKEDSSLVIKSSVQSGEFALPKPADLSAMSGYHLGMQSCAVPRRHCRLPVTHCAEAGVPFESEFNACMDPDSCSFPDLPLSRPAALSATVAWSSVERNELSTSTA